MWFANAADDFVKKYDVPNDCDGPRHFGEGVALMLVRILNYIARKHSKRAGRAAALRVRSIADQWLAENQ